MIAAFHMHLGGRVSDVDDGDDIDDDDVIDDDIDVSAGVAQCQ